MNKSDFAEKIDLASLKSEVDKLDIAKTKTVPTDLSKLSNVIHSNVIKKTAHDMILTNKILKKRSKILIKRYLISVNI